MRVVLAVLVSLFVIGSAFAQAPVTAPVVPVVDAATKARLDTVQRAATVATSSCQALDAVKVYNEIRASTQADVEAKYPGFTVNWSTLGLMAKPAK